MAGTERFDDPLRATLAAVAPGTALRDGLERILRGRTGGLTAEGAGETADAFQRRHADGQILRPGGPAMAAVVDD